jgi:diadenosine tetraphosphatase ApaH/serine/threonine PP2A family protein phosphatase
VTAAVLSDIHGNLEALEAVLADLDRRGVAAVACLGDIVGYGADPNLCIERLRPRLEAAVVGNHDVAACGQLKLGGFHSDAATAARWTTAQLAAGNAGWLAGLPYSTTWLGVRLVHASPLEPGEWQYVLSIADAAEEMPAFPERLCLIGHSHVAGAFLADDGHIGYTRSPKCALRGSQRAIVNVGSVGQPRDGDPRAAYLLLDPETPAFEHVRVEYDVETAMRKIRDAGLPQFLAERLRWGE